MRPSPTVIAADGKDGYSYGFQQNQPQNKGWFSGLRAKISQLSGLSEWMNQLGISETRANNNNNNISPSTSSDAMEDDLCYGDIHLDDEQQNNKEHDPEVWDWGSCLLADLDSNHKWNDTLEKQHFGPLHDLLTLGGHKGQGHTFISISLLHPTWCDKCGDFIWGILKQAVKCQNCNFTCHQRCRELVNLDCRSAGSSMASDDFSLYPKLLDGTLGTIPKHLNIPSTPQSPVSDKENRAYENPLFSPSKFSSTLPKGFSPLPSTPSPAGTAKPNEFVQTPNGRAFRVEECYVKEDTPFEWTNEYKEINLEKDLEGYNSKSGNLKMYLSPDGDSFSGLLQVHMNFSRPISVIAGQSMPNVYDIQSGTASTSSTCQRTITSFFLPRNTVKVININSKMTTRQMIVTLLRKFRVADNPRKFALYECDHSANEEKCTLLRQMRRISDDACPLRVALNWGSAYSGKSLILQENDTGDILWDAFEVPELENFLRILGMEEQQYQWQIKQKFNQYRYYLETELVQRGVSTEISDVPLEQAPTLPQKDYNPYGTSDSMIVSDVFHTIKDSEVPMEEPHYVNIEQLRAMSNSTKL